MAADGDIWPAVDRLVDRAARVEDLRAHRIHLLAARRWRAAGRPVPPELQADERRAVVAALTAPVLLRRVREACDGPLVLVKGPEVGARYPDPALRAYHDLDLLVPDPPAAQRALLAAGFVEVGDPRLYEDIHHERPLAAPDLPLHLELHSEPKWPDAGAPPRTEELLGAAIPTALGVDGVGTLPSAHHALVLAAHSWAHSPLRRVGELVDVAVVSDGAHSGELRALAARWGLRRIWDTTAAAADALLDGGRPTWPLRTWARQLPAVRDRTVLETHLEHWLSGFSALPLGGALAAGAGALATELRSAPGEPTAAKLSRTRLAVRNALVRRSEHVEQVERAGLRAPLFYELESAGADDRGPDPNDEGAGPAEGRAS